MKISRKVMALAAALAAGTGAQALTLTFDGLSGIYSGSSLGTNMTGDGQFIAYTEAGYILTLNTTNLATSPNGAHIGDSSHDSFGWHDQDHNPGAFVTLTKVGGGVFDLISFDYLSSNNDMQVTANTGDTLALPGDNYQPAVPAHLHNVTSVSFSSTGLTYLELDNIVVTTGGVPEPATWATMLLGLGMVGAAVRRRQKVTVSFG